LRRKLVSANVNVVLNCVCKLFCAQKTAGAEMKALAVLAVLSLGLLGPGAASAQTVQQSGNVFHIAACSTNVGPGQARCHAHVVTDSRGNFVTGQASPSAAPLGYSPRDLRFAYTITSQGSQSTTIAIVDAYGYPNADHDLAVYRRKFGLPDCSAANQCFLKYNQRGQTGAYPVEDVGWAEETALDLDMASAMCPNCRIVLVEADSNSYADLAAAENEAASLGPVVISNSYGGGEYYTKPYDAAYTHPGIAITASSGDEGYGVLFPAASPHVIAVGGTSLFRDTSASRGWFEAAWSGSGSGCSAIYAKPAHQTDALCPKRMVADVSAVADPYTGVAVYAPVSATASEWLEFGGTSVSAPLIAGIIATHGHTTGDKKLYEAYSQAWFNDITSGSNGRCGDLYYCTAGPGYDGPTGLGTPKGGNAF
jgi:subtilase family serine protease